VERSRRWSPAFHPDPSPQSQERKRKKKERKKKEKRKKKERREAKRRQTRSPRSALRRDAPPSVSSPARGGGYGGGRSPVGVPPRRLLQRTNAAAQLLGRYPLPAVTKCSDLSRTGHSAGRACLPEPPGSGGDEPPPAGAAPAPSAGITGRRPLSGGMSAPIVKPIAAVKRFVARGFVRLNPDVTRTHVRRRSAAHALTEKICEKRFAKREDRV
jgi:hypothetical protein